MICATEDVSNQIDRTTSPLSTGQRLAVLAVIAGAYAYLYFSGKLK